MITIPKLKADDTTFDADELDEAEYSEEDFQRYDGPLPPEGTLLIGRIQKMWLGTTQNDDDMLVSRFVADDNLGSLAGYNGWSALDYAAITAAAKFRWAPLLRAIGVTIQDVKKRLYANKVDEFAGWPIEKIADWVPDSDESWVTVVTKRERYNGEWRAKVGKWLEYQEPEDDGKPPVTDDDNNEEPEPARPAKRGRSAPAKAKISEPEPEEPEEEEPEAKPTRGRGRQPAAKPATPAKPARGRGRSSGATDEPPF